MSDSTDHQPPQEIDELVMQKDGDTVRIFAVVDDEQVFYAEPEVARSSTTMRAALQTWVARAYEEELDDADTEGAFQ